MRQYGAQAHTLNQGERRLGAVLPGILNAKQSLEGIEARSTKALRRVVRGLGVALDPYVQIEPLPSSTSLLAGRTAMSFASVKGIPASTSTSRSSTTSPSNVKSVMSGVKVLRIFFDHLKLRRAV